MAWTVKNKFLLLSGLLLWICTELAQADFNSSYDGFKTISGFDLDHDGNRFLYEADSSVHFGHVRDELDAEYSSTPTNSLLNTPEDRDVRLPFDENRLPVNTDTTTSELTDLYAFMKGSVRTDGKLVGSWRYLDGGLWSAANVRETRPLVYCGTESFFLRFSLTRLSSVYLGKARMHPLSAFSHCYHVALKFGPVLILRAFYRGSCLGQWQVEGHQRFYSLDVQYFDRILMRDVQGTATCPAPAASAEPAVTCGKTGVGVKLPAGPLKEVKVLGPSGLIPVRDALKSCGYSLNERQTHNSLFVKYTGCHVNFQTTF